ERRGLVLVGRDRQRAERSPVERRVDRDDLVARLALRVPIAARELQTGLDRLGAAVAEKRAREARQVCQPLGELPLQRMVEEVRRVDERLALFADRAREPAM